MKKKLLLASLFATLCLTSCSFNITNIGKKEENTEDNTEENKKYQIYQLAVEAGYTGTYEQWL